MMFFAFEALLLKIIGLPYADIRMVVLRVIESAIRIL